MSELCHVCNLVPCCNKKGLFCKACLTFYRNHLFDFQELECKNNETCALESKRAVSTSNGAIFRFFCPRCRFAKCVRVAAERPEAYLATSSPTNAPQNSPVDCSKTRNSDGQYETALPRDSRDDHDDEETCYHDFIKRVSELLNSYPTQ